VSRSGPRPRRALGPGGSARSAFPRTGWHWAAPGRRLDWCSTSGLRVRPGGLGLALGRAGAVGASEMAGHCGGVTVIPARPASSPRSAPGTPCLPGISNRPGGADRPAPSYGVVRKSPGRRTNSRRYPPSPRAPQIPARERTKPTARPGGGVVAVPGSRMLHLSTGAQYH
jgi:hypothetical protein